MDVSVVIPAKNEAGSIEHCLEYLVAQADAGDEIIVLDNGSDDDTAAIADSFDAVTVIDAPDEKLPGDSHYRGLSQLRQFGAEQASKPVVATTDADTLPPTGWLDRIKAHFENDPELSVVWGVVVDENGVPVRNLTGKYLTFVGGVSGANTAFRRAHFEELRDGYVGWPMFEDVALITRLARSGKAVHDRDMVMVSDLDRRRYQTIPLLATSGATAIGGGLLGGPIAAAAAGTGVGLAGTELFYEAAPETRYHHDQIGLGSIIAGSLIGGPAGLGLAGAGAGVVGHHVLTEGTSAIPTEMLQQTDAVCEIPIGDNGSDVTVINCEPPEPTTAALTRVLAGAAGGAVIGKLVQVARAKA